MKKWISLVLALVMTLCMSTAWAAEVAPMSISPGDTGTIHVNGLKEDGLTIHVYKIISVDFDVNAGTDKGYSWDASVATWLEGKASYKAYVGDENKVTTAFTDLQSSTMSDFFNDLAATIAAKKIDIADLKDNAHKHDTAADPHYDIARLDMGQYLILVSGGVKVYAPMVASVLPKFENGAFSIEDGSVTAKSSTPSLEKKVNDKDEDTSGDEDYLGKEIRFDIRADIPEYPANATNKTYTISDTMSQGLTYTPDTLQVYGVASDNTETLLIAGTAYTLTAPAVDGTTGVTTFKAAFTYDQISSYNKVHITYKATINENAVIGNVTANPNKAELTYSNDPYGSTTHKIDDTVKVFTYGLKVHKQDGSNNNVALAGAEFELYKITTESGEEKKERISGNASLVTNDQGLIEIKNLDEGLYELQEVKAPNGYSPLEFPIRFTITGEKNGGTLTGNVDGGSGNGWETGYYETTIVNYKQTGLPSTGGTGTTVFTVVGIVLIAGCVLAVILRKRKSEK